MAGKTHSSILSLAIIAVLVFGAVCPVIAYADDRNPPDTPTTEATNACTANGDCPSSNGGPATTADDDDVTVEATSTPAPEATLEPVSTATEVPTEATSTPDEAPTQVGSEGNTSSGEATPPPTVDASAPAAVETPPVPDTSILDQVPDNTTVTVLDAAGQSAPLATQVAADAIATSDPMWCPIVNGQATAPGGAGCTQSFTSFNDLLTFLSGNAAFQGAGTIYVQQGTYNGGETAIDLNSASYDLSNIRNSDLTITGGWNTGTNVVDPASTSNFTIPILIGTSTNPWGGSLVINNITINKTSGTGLTLYSQGDITVSNVSSTNSVNGAGAELNAGGGVTINNSKFDRNKTAGAIIRAGGNVAIASSSFSNPANGRRQVTGLDIVNSGTVSLTDVLANTNREAGATINSGGRVTILNSYFSDTKSMKGSGANTTFLGYGLQVFTPDAIDLSFVTANDNFLWGASLQAGGAVTIGDSIFNANTTASPGFIDDTGLIVKSGGAVSLNNVQANDNRLIGATIEATGDVSVNSSTFTNNKGVTLDSAGTPTFHGYGLQVVTSGGIFLNQVDASNNTLFGAHLEGGTDVAVDSSIFSNETSPSASVPTGRGLEIIAPGNIFLSNITLDNNQTFGANVQAGGNIFLDTITATNNGLNGVETQGACTTVSLTSGNYSNNGGYGLTITNASLNQIVAPTFAGNGAGDILQDPGSCVFPAAGTTGNGNGNSSGAGTLNSGNPGQIVPQNSPAQFAAQGTTNLASGKNASLTGASVAPKLTLASFLQESRILNGGIHVSIFTGDYVYIYSDSGLHIIALSPSSILAMQ